MAKGLVRKLALALLLGGGIVPAASARDVFLVGDSIRLGYGPEVRRIMEARGDRVFQPDENCRFAQYTLRGIVDWAEAVPDRKSIEVVHWNNGLWDLGELVPGECVSPLGLYTNNLVRVVRQIRREFPNARVVFATTTPVNEHATSRWHTLGNSEVDRYNAAAKAALKDKVDAFDDLNAFVKTRGLSAHYRDIVHYTPEGSRLLAEEVVRVIDAVR